MMVRYRKLSEKKPGRSYRVAPKRGEENSVAQQSSESRSIITRHNTVGKTECQSHSDASDTARSAATAMSLRKKPTDNSTKGTMNSWTRWGSTGFAMVFSKIFPVSAGTESLDAVETDTASVRSLFGIIDNEKSASPRLVETTPLTKFRSHMDLEEIPLSKKTSNCSITVKGQVEGTANTEPPVSALLQNMEECRPSECSDKDIAQLRKAPTKTPQSHSANSKHREKSLSDYDRSLSNAVAEEKEKQAVFADAQATISVIENCKTLCQSADSTEIENGADALKTLEATDSPSPQKTPVKIPESHAKNSKQPEKSLSESASSNSAAQTKEPAVLVDIDPTIASIHKNQKEDRPPESKETTNSELLQEASLTKSGSHASKLQQGEKLTSTDSCGNAVTVPNGQTGTTDTEKCVVDTQKNESSESSKRKDIGGTLKVLCSKKANKRGPPLSRQSETIETEPNILAIEQIPSSESAERKNDTDALSMRDHGQDAFLQKSPAEKSMTKESLKISGPVPKGPRVTAHTEPNTDIIQKKKRRRQTSESTEKATETHSTETLEHFSIDDLASILVDIQSAAQERVGQQAQQLKTDLAALPFTNGKKRPAKAAPTTSTKKGMKLRRVVVSPQKLRDWRQSQQKQVLRAANTVTKAIQSGSWPSPYQLADEQNKERDVDSCLNQYQLQASHKNFVCVALRKFCIDIIVPAMADSAPPSSGNTSLRERRTFLGSLLLLREVLIQNAATIFGSEAMVKTSETQEAGETSASAVYDEALFSVKVLATAVILMGLEEETEEHDLCAEFLELTTAYDRGSKQFDKCLPVIDDNDVIYFPNRQRMGASERIAWKLNCNIQQDQHPLAMMSRQREHKGNGDNPQKAASVHPIASPTAAHVSLIKRWTPKPHAT